MKKFFLLTFVLTALPFAWTRAAVEVPLNLRLRI